MAIHRQTSLSTRLVAAVAMVGMLVVNNPCLCSAQENPPDGAITTAGQSLLTPRQAAELLRLSQSRPAEPTPLILFTDANRDPDDLSVLVLASWLHDHGCIDLRCVVTTLGDSDTRTKRARFVRSVLNRLGDENTPVGVGVDYIPDVRDAVGNVDVRASEGRRRDHAKFIETPLLDPLAEVQSDGYGLLIATLESVPDHSAVLLINSGMPDVARLLEEAPAIATRKVSRVVIMGGIDQQLDDRGHVMADRRAYNNTTVQPAADHVYRRVQELQLPLTVVTREAAYAAAVSRSYYDAVAATGNPIGVYLEQQQKQSLEQLWLGIREGTLPPALTPSWFLKTFTDIEIDSPAAADVLRDAAAHPDDFKLICQQVSRFNLYDPLALLAATPCAEPMVFRASVPDGVKSDVSVIGTDSVLDPQFVKDLLSAMVIQRLSSAVPLKSRVSKASGYPDRFHVDERDAPWDRPLPGYDPPEYTAEVVFRNAGIWADPADVKDVTRRFVTGLASGEIAVPTDSRGRPLNPLGRTGLEGRGLLGRWGRNPAGDPLLTRVSPETGRLQVLVIERKDSGQMALPGGMADEGEDIAATVARELREETSAGLSFENATVLFSGIVDDPRNTDNAWVETTVLHRHLSLEDQLSLRLQAGDDAKSVRWTDITPHLLSSMYASHSDYVRLALLNLNDVPELRQQADELLGP